MSGLARQTSTKGGQTAVVLHSSEARRCPAPARRWSSGNQVLQRLLRTETIQPKLTINQPGDEFEREADRVADTVMRMSVTGIGDPPDIQRLCSACEAEQEPPVVQRMCTECKEELHRKPRPGGEQAPTIPPAQEAQVVALREGGLPLSKSVRAFFEPRFGRDFSDVRIHAGQAAAETVGAINALAYTAGNHIVFGAGQYAPHTDAGKRLLAHELAHTIQQGSAASSVQRLGDLTKVPAGLGCPIATDSPSSVISEFLFPNSGTTLTAAQQASVEAFIVSWRAAGGSSTVRVDGFASHAGSDELNWRLSCDRARAVIDELGHPSSGRAPGIPASLLTLFAQGETGEFSKLTGADRDGPNRRATISSLIPPAPACPSITCPFAPTQPPLPSPPVPPPEPQRINPGITSGALCRGACGADCPSTCRSGAHIVRCITDAKSGCHATCTYTNVLLCSTHEACRTHDACYDACAVGRELGLCSCPARACLAGTTTCTNPCHCACDHGCCSAHGASDCLGWARGATSPSDGTFTYAAAATAGPASPGPCPP